MSQFVGELRLRMLGTEMAFLSTQQDLNFEAGEFYETRAPSSFVSFYHSVPGRKGRYSRVNPS